MYQNSALADLDSEKSSIENMGDADSEIIVPVQEIEAWMDEALEEVDDGLQHLISLMGSLNERTKEVLLEFKSLKSLKRFFMSLNLFVVPVILAILMCYGARESLDGNLSGFETGFQMTLNVLMFLSGAIGLPFYFYSIFESLHSTKTRKEYSSLSQSSIERLSELARMLTNRMPDNMRLGLERRSSYRFLESTNAGSSFESRHFIRRLSESVLQTFDPVMKVRNRKEHHEGKQGEEVDVTTQSNRERQGDDLPLCYELQLRSYDQSPDLSIKIEPTKKDKPSNVSAETECKKFYSLQEAPSKFEQPENETFEIPS